MSKKYEFPKSMNDVPTYYCGGCGHGIVHKLIAQVIDEMNLQSDVLLVAPVGCAVYAYNYLNVDSCEAAHGRAPAVATGMKRVHPDKVVISYQGDGDLLAIGTAETVHAANRGENITVIFINNAIYGMTGGQMAPTTLEGMKTATCPYGRNTDMYGFPLRISDLLKEIDGTCYVTRQSVHKTANIVRAKKAIRKAFQNSIDGKGTSIVEFVSHCNTNWKMTPVQSNAWMEEHMFAKYPLGDLKDTPKKRFDEINHL